MLEYSLLQVFCFYFAFPNRTITEMFQVTSDFIGITNAIHIMDQTNTDSDSGSDDSDTRTIVDDDKTECDIFLDELDDISEIPDDPS